MSDCSLSLHPLNSSSLSSVSTSCPISSPLCSAHHPPRGRSCRVIFPLRTRRMGSMALWRYKPLLQFTLSSRLVRCDKNETQLLILIHVHAVLLARLVFLRVSRLFSHHCHHLSATLLPTSALWFKSTSSFLDHLRRFGESTFTFRALDSWCCLLVVLNFFRNSLHHPSMISNNIS